MRKSMFASFAALVLGASLALTGCQVGDDGGDDGSDNPADDDGGDDNDRPDAGGGGGGEPCPPSVEDFETEVFDKALTACVGCHGGRPFSLSNSDMAANLAEATDFAKTLLEGKPALRAKPAGEVGHAGNVSGPIHPPGSAGYDILDQFVGQVTGADGACD